MKKIYLNTLWGRLGIALLFLITALIIHSCRKDAKLTQQQINDEIAAANFPVTDAKAWFNGNKTALATKVKINSDASFLNLLANLHRFGTAPARQWILIITWWKPLPDML